MRQQWATSTREGTMENIENIDHLELVWMGWVLSDITQFSVSIIQIMWVPWMSICLDEFWIIVSITQFSDFWVMSYENWKHILGVFSFYNSSLKNQRIKWWKQWSKTHPNKFSSMGPTRFGWWKRKIEWYHSKLITSKQALIKENKICNWFFKKINKIKAVCLSRYIW